VNGAVWGLVVWVGEDSLKVRSEGHWELFGRDPVLPSV
jgi:hypothetical protein